jgi:hypothetical protein
MFKIKDFFKCGFIKYNKNQPLVTYNATKLSDIQNIIVPYLEKNPLQGTKYNDYLDFVQIMTIMLNKDHLTLEGLDKVKNIKNGMNDNRKG